MTPDQIKQRLADAGLMVKPLVWREWPKNFGWASNAGHVINAERGAFWLEGRIARKRFPTHTAAIAFADAYHERRIYNALQEIEVWKT